MGRKSIYFLLTPGLVLIALFLVVPLFSTIAPTLQVEGQGFSLAKYISFFTDEYTMKIYWRTLNLSLIATLISAILGFPTAYYISKAKPNLKGLYTIFAVFPLLTSPVVRSFSWIVVLGKYGIVNNTLLGLHLIQEPLKLLYNEFAVVIGLTNLFLPLMIMSLIGVMENIDHHLVEAAESLGASKMKSFLKVVLPLSIPGLIVGSVLVFTGSFTAYTTPQLLGGNKSKVLATLIYQQALTLFDWNGAAVIATIMILTTILISAGINKLTAGVSGKGGA
ncbi:MAG TPA: ABC transporter permease [Bacillota bacterium]|nr:ABC transporter permease [Bacillota bacterium]